MNFLKRIRSSLNRLLSPQPGKNGSSMAFVMIIGAVLVIWVLAIMPLMVAVGNNSLTLQGSYADYLGSRSAIEFCKGELENIVETKPPYTFCVVKNGDTYTAIPKMDSISLSTQYDNAINRDPDATDVNNINDDVDTDDVPKNTAEGNSVVAICAIAQDEKEENVYNIIITTYNNGKKGLTYSTVYTIRGSLLINPESYKQTQALPLSDFVLVDGKLGSKIVWKSNIRDLASHDFSYVTDLSYVYESLLPLTESADADSGEYPAVFKTPVYPAGGGTAPTLPEIPGATEPKPEVTKPDYTDDKWYPPIPIKEDDRTEKIGEIWYKIEKRTYTYKNNYGWTREGEKDTIRIYLQSSEENTTDITEKCKIYLNGTKFDAYVNKDVHGHNIPTSGIHQVSVDFEGYDDNKILAAHGLILGEIGEATTTSTVNQKAPVKTGIRINGTTVTIDSHDSNTGAVYGYCAVDNFPNIDWNDNSDDASFQDLNISTAYYFFAYKPEAYQNGTYYAPSDVTYMGCVYPMETTTQLQNSSDYLIVAKNSSGNYYAMGRKNNSITQQHIGTLPTLIASTPDYSNNYLWHVENSNNSFTFRNLGNNKYLSLNGNAKIDWGIKWNFNLYLAENKEYASFTYNDNKLSRRIQSSYFSNTGYILFESGSFKAAANGSEIYFVKIPTEAPAEPNTRLIQIASNFVNMSESSIVHGTALSDVITGTYSDLKANGNENTDKLNVGKYNVTAIVGNSTFNLGMIEVTKASLSGNLTIEATQDDHTVAVEVKAMNVTNAGAHWIGYKATGSSEYAWFPAYENNGKYACKFTLRYGDYEFAAYETGSLNYNPLMSAPIPVSLTDPAEEVPDGGEEGGSGEGGSGVVDPNVPQDSVMKGSSLYFMGRDNTTLSNGTPVNFSIDTCGVNIYLTTDLLVLRHGIKGSGKVFISPYTTGDHEQNDTLLFVVNDFKNAKGVTFKALHFYKIPSGMDINNVHGDAFSNLECKDLGSDNTEEIKQIQYWFRKGLYPEINLDIAYLDRNVSGTGDKYYTDKDETDTYRKPDNRQLANIISSETIGWTSNGILTGYDTTRYPQYAICAFVTGVTKNAPDESGNAVAISYTANRILLAAEITENNKVSKTLNVPTDIVFSTRYFSLHADSVVQTVPNTSFILKNLGEDENFFKWLSNALKITNYRSKTMQIDYERATTISGNNNVQYISPQICRYSDGTDLFGGLQNQSLMATYTVTEIENMFTNPIYSIVKTVDRYVTIEPLAGSDSMTFGTATTAELDIYANYVFFSPTVKNITLYGHKWAETTKILFNTQESGYTTEEYFGLFKNHSSDAYSGTIVYFGSEITLTEYKYAIFGEDEVYTKKIASGFYYIPAELNGVSIWALVKPETGDNAYKITTDQLKAYSVYINPETGALNKAYVDTGIFDNTAEGAGGFSGGNVG